MPKNKPQPRPLTGPSPGLSVQNNGFELMILQTQAKKVIGSLHDTVTDLVNHKEMVETQNGWQKWKEHVEKSKLAKFEAPDIKDWTFIRVWIFKKLQKFVWKMLLVSKLCSPAILSNFRKTQAGISLCNGLRLKLGHFHIFDMLFSFLASVPYHNCFWWLTRSCDRVMQRAYYLWRNILNLTLTYCCTHNYLSFVFPVILVQLLSKQPAKNKME